MIGIGTRISPDWLQRPEDLDYVRQIGIEHVDITLDMVDGYQASGGAVDEAALASVIERLAAHGLRIERANYLNSELLPVFTAGAADADQVIARAAAAADTLGAAGIPVLGLQMFQAAQLLPDRRAHTHSWRAGRGGYEYLHIDMRDAAEPAEAPEGTPAADQQWERLLALYRAVVPVAERHGMRVAMHGNDPPLPLIHGVPQIMHNRAGFDRLFGEVPNANNGMTFCVGTRYESGEDVFELIRHFGAQRRLFHVHFRNVVGTLPADGAYSEVAPDEGDLDMAAVVRALHEVGYDGVIDYDHVMRLVGDRAGRSYIAYCVGYMRGLLNAVQGPDPRA